MIKKALFLFLLGVLCAGTALAGTKRQVTFKLDGKTAGGELIAVLPGTGGSVEFYFNPTQLPDGSFGYSTNIVWYDGAHSQSVEGLLPLSVIKGGLGGPLTVNITDQDFYIEPGSPFYDDGAFISLQGTFTHYAGPDSNSYSQRGTVIQTHTDAAGITETSRFTGSGISTSATFEGTFVTGTTATSTGDTYQLSVQGPNPNADIFVQVGSETDITTTP